MVEAERLYIPAAGRDWALPFYDTLTRLLGADSARKDMLNQVTLTPGQQVLDIGCGTGTLAVTLKRNHPQVEVLGLDPDPKALALAARKAERAGVLLHLDKGYSDALPYRDQHFDHVFSCFMFHHLEADTKEKTLREVKRVLRPGGVLHLLDFARVDEAGHLRAHIAIPHRRLRDNSEARIRQLTEAAGFRSPTSMKERTSLLGLLKIRWYDLRPQN